MFKKYIVFYITVIFSPFLFASQLEMQEITKKSYTRNWEVPLKELGAAAALFGSSYVVPGDARTYGIQDIALTASNGLAVDAASRLVKNTLEVFAEELGRGHMSHKKKYDQKKLEDLAQKYIYPKIRATRLAISETRHIIMLMLQLSLACWMANATRSDKYEVMSSSTLLLSFALIIMGIRYNAHEVWYGLTTGNTRDDLPVVRLANAATDTLLSQVLIPHYNIGNSMYIANNLTTGQYAFYRFLQTNADYEFFTGLAQMLWNILSYVKDLKEKKSLIEILPARAPERSVMTAFTKSSTSEFFKGLMRMFCKASSYGKRRNAEHPLAQELTPQKASGHVSDGLLLQNPTDNAPEGNEPAMRETPMVREKSIINQGFITPQNYHDEHQESRIKEKRRGQADPLRATDQSRGQARPAPGIETEQDRLREEALQRLTDLSKQRTVNLLEMDAEINAMLRFLPAARRVDMGHNKEAIIISFEHGRNYRLTFEAPHQQRAADSNEYKASRKERVLDVLRICYLLGWSEDRIKSYMARNEIVSFYNLPAFLVHILWTRGEQV